MFKKKEENIIDILGCELRKRDNPEDLKTSILGKVVDLSPLTVSISNGYILLVEGNELEVSEWFRKRCNIDKEGKITNASNESLSEIHSQTGKRLDKIEEYIK